MKHNEHQGTYWKSIENQGQEMKCKEKTMQIT